MQNTSKESEIDDRILRDIVNIPEEEGSEERKHVTETNTNERGLQKRTSLHLVERSKPTLSSEENREDGSNLETTSCRHPAQMLEYSIMEDTNSNEKMGDKVTFRSSKQQGCFMTDIPQDLCESGGEILATSKLNQSDENRIKFLLNYCAFQPEGQSKPINGRNVSSQELAAKEFTCYGGMELANQMSRLDARLADLRCDKTKKLVESDNISNNTMDEINKKLHDLQNCTLPSVKYKDCCSEDDNCGSFGRIQNDRNEQTRTFASTRPFVTKEDINQIYEESKISLDRHGAQIAAREDIDILLATLKPIMISDK